PAAIYTPSLHDALPILNSGANLSGENEPTRATASFVTGGLLKTLGVAPLLGRLITPADDDSGASLVANISYGLWQSVYAGDRNIDRKSTRLNSSHGSIS